MNAMLKDAAAADGLTSWLAPSRTAVVVVDMQTDFASPEGALGKAGLDMTTAQAALRAAERLAQGAQASVGMNT